MCCPHSAQKREVPRMAVSRPCKGNNQLYTLNGSYIPYIPDIPNKQPGYHQEFQVPNLEGLLNLIFGYFGGGVKPLT